MNVKDLPQNTTFGLEDVIFLYIINIDFKPL